MLAMLKGGGGGVTKCVEVVLPQEVLAILWGGGGTQSYHPLNKKFYPVLRARDFPIL